MCTAFSRPTQPNHHHKRLSDAIYLQMLMGGSHKFALSPDEYVFGAIAIYLDIINLFMHILQILNSSRDN
jgi:FtsH-binding integral membrane protein